MTDINKSFEDHLRDISFEGHLGDIQKTFRGLNQLIEEKLTLDEILSIKRELNNVSRSIQFLAGSIKKGTEEAAKDIWKSYYNMRGLSEHIEREFKNIVHKRLRPRTDYFGFKLDCKYKNYAFYDLKIGYYEKKVSND